MKGNILLFINISFLEAVSLFENYFHIKKMFPKMEFNFQNRKNKLILGFIL